MEKEIDKLFSNPSKEFIDKCLQVVFNNYIILGDILDKEQVQEQLGRELTEEEFAEGQDKALNYFSNGNFDNHLEEFFDEIKEDN